MTSAGAAEPGSAASERLALALQAGRIGTWHWDFVTGRIDRDAAMDELLGIEARSNPPAFEEYMARVHPEDQPAMMRNLHESLADHAPVLTAEHRIIRPDGAVRWFEAKARLSYAPDGSPTELVGVVVDITERRRSEEARAAALQAQDLASRRAGAVERRLALLARAADLLDTPLDIDAALQHVADLSIGALADWCTVDLVTDGRIHHAAVAHRDDAMVARAREVKELYPQDVEEPGFRHIITSLQPLFVREFDYRLVDETVPDPEYRRILREFNISSFLVVPLVAGGKGIGIITLVACHGRLLDPEAVELAVDLGRRAGAAVEKTRLYAELRETSQVLQSSLLPATLPDIPGVTLSAHYRSGTEGMQIGGDFYDVFRTGPERWWVALGDVCGKGPAAAALTAAVRYTVRAVAPDTTDPAVVLRRLNEVLLDQVAEGQFTSLVLATFVPSATASLAPLPVEELLLSLASAGHPAPLLFREGQVTALPCAGTVVGLLPDIEVESIGVVLGSGDSLLLYTDGASEARALDGEQVGEVGLRQLLAAHHDGPSDTRSQRVAEGLLHLTGGTLRDDLALLSLGVDAPR